MYVCPHHVCVRSSLLSVEEQVGRLNGRSRRDHCWDWHPHGTAEEEEVYDMKERGEKVNLCDNPQTLFSALSLTPAPSAEPEAEPELRSFNAR